MRLVVTLGNTNIVLRFSFSRFLSQNIVLFLFVRSLEMASVLNVMVVRAAAYLTSHNRKDHELLHLEAIDLLRKASFIS